MIILPNKKHPLHLLASLCLSAVFSNLTWMSLKGFIIVFLFSFHFSENSSFLSVFFFPFVFANVF